MAYGLKYISRFKNRIQRDIYRIEIHESGWSGIETELTSAEDSPFVANYPTGDTDILTPIKSAEFTFSFLIDNDDIAPFYSGNADINIFLTHRIDIYDQTGTNNITPGMLIEIASTTYHIESVLYDSLTDILTLMVTENVLDAFLPAEDFFVFSRLGIENFYSNDDQKFRVDFYFESDELGGGTEKLLYTSYLIQEGTSEPLTDSKHVITFKSTDNLGLLKNKFWNDTSNSPEVTVALGAYIREGLQETGLYSHNSTIDMSLPLRLYNNLYENTIDDRSDSSTADPFAQIILYPNMFKGADNVWQNLYNIIEQILGALNADLLMADGYWNVRRIPEYRLFTDGEIPGTEYIYNGSGTDITAVTLEPLATIQRSTGEVVPVKEDQTKSILRPFKYCSAKFEYNTPPFIIHNDLQLPEGATPYFVHNVGDLEYSHYSIPTYFPEWVQRGGIDSYIEIVTDTANDDAEVERYIVIQPDDSLTGGVQFNPIPVTAGDKLDFSLRWKTDVDTDDLIRFWVRFVLIDTVGTNYNLQDNAGTGNNEFVWVGPSVSADIWDTGDGIYHELTNPDDLDTSDWQTWNLAESDFSTQPIPLIPVDGMLLIEVRGPNAGSQTDRQIVFFKDINLQIDQYVNYSTQITGHTHKDEVASQIKAVDEKDITIDDTPRSTIAGTLFTDVTTDFEYTDINTGQSTGIGNVYFTRTTLWHRAEIVEELRLGNITTQEREQLRYTARFPIEGTFKNLRYDTDKFISPLTLFAFYFIPSKYFVAASMKIDYMQCTFKAMLQEVYKDNESDFEDTYTFNYIYETE